ncbi:hypothetical protein D3P07_05870 [Paenibacillus sp. 1011MAR3C5]|uniref:hypothetical protein n=1 Tax=Paenibacillus sp. 1011MAR3C5 TaxID=1675787 RepID=UPI000E6D25F4|nr:hypothetical protein [Paenibacillus sp. 1011MAR3C5]RJE89758.1 hypothetical protein D3P07_05870 [Paenibacillus sp. 1011MAR3C5]
MFDPTVFDNLKVAFENELYDMDNLDRIIDITGRKDVLDFAVMSREFSVSFRLAGSSDGVTAELVLDTSLRDLSAEILKLQGEKAACSLAIRFYTEVGADDADARCREIERCIADIWMPDDSPVQTLSRVYGENNERYRNQAELRFRRRIGEEQMEDIPELIEHAVRTLEALA